MKTINLLLDSNPYLRLAHPVFKNSNNVNIDQKENKSITIFALNITAIAICSSLIKIRKL